MKLSVVIVNYNVKYFLEQCLVSVATALKGIDSEVFVVDNASADGSCQMVQKRFPKVILISNKENFGFSYANNQAMRLAKGEYVLLLNPDTVVEEQTFRKCIEFMDLHTKAGSLSVKMIDGKGRFLPESKRAVPSPIVSFFKIFGLSRLFPNSKFFARYHMGHLGENETNEIEILPGAFMFMRKSALDKVGLLDESFFMYGEDIDLSYRFLKAGYKNFYFPETTIIHYKGESTKKGSINYVLVFYNAMIIFAKKHFSKKNARIYITLIYTAIYFRAFLSILKRFTSKVILPLLDATAIAIGFWLIPSFWEQYYFNSPEYFPQQTIIILATFYGLLSIVWLWLVGAYEKPQKLFAAAKGMGLSSLIFLLAYALMPESLRFSRVVTLLTSAWSILAVQIIHLALGLIKINSFHIFQKKKRIAIVGSPEEAKRILSIFENAKIEAQYVGLVAPTEQMTNAEYIASINQLPEFVRINNVDEIIFCSTDIKSEVIIENMLELVSTGVDYKIAPPDSLSVIGSNSIETQGELYTVDFNAISRPINLRKKRLFDMIVSLILLPLLPIIAIYSYKTLRLYKELFKVLFGFKSWIGYCFVADADFSHLPRIRKGVFSTVNIDNKPVSAEVVNRVNLLYARNYSIINDFALLWKGMRTG